MRRSSLLLGDCSPIAHPFSHSPSVLRQVGTRPSAQFVSIRPSRIRAASGAHNLLVSITCTATAPAPADVNTLRRDLGKRTRWVPRAAFGAKLVAPVVWTPRRCSARARTNDKTPQDCAKAFEHRPDCFGERRRAALRVRQVSRTRDGSSCHFISYLKPHSQCCSSRTGATRVSWRQHMALQFPFGPALWLEDSKHSTESGSETASNGNTWSRQLVPEPRLAKTLADSAFCVKVEPWFRASPASIVAAKCLICGGPEPPDTVENTKPACPTSRVPEFETQAHLYC